MVVIFEYIWDIKMDLLLGLVVSVLFILAAEFRYFIRKERMRWGRRILLLCLGVYFSLLFALTISPVYGGWSLSNIGKNINLTPFQVLEVAALDYVNFFGNLILFVPFGILLVLLSYRCRNIFVTAAFGLILSIGIEVMQLFSLRSTDIDDVLLNTCGAVFGFLIGKILLHIFPSLQCIREILGKGSKVRYGGGIFLLFISVFLSVCAHGYTERMSIHLNVTSQHFNHLSIEAANIYLCEQDVDYPLYERNSHARIAPASTTKLLSALTALDFCALDEVVTVGNEIYKISEDSSRAWLYPGHQLTIEQLLVALLLPSGNDAAYTLAVYTGRKIAQSIDLSEIQAIRLFVEKMNEKAVSVGAVHSYFTTPDGYDDPKQYTTAYDLAQIANACLNIRILREIMDCYEISQTWTSGEQITYHSTNELKNPLSPYYHPQVIGLKTGSSLAAGDCLISAVKIGKKIYICVVMNSTEKGRWTETLQMYRLLETLK